MRVSEIYKDISIKYDHKINDVVTNSKEVLPNTIFVAIKGYRVDGNNYIDEAIANGARTIITENEYITNSSVNIIKVSNTKKELSLLLNKLYGSKLKNFKIIGITGTNGKTTCCNLLYHYLLFLKKPVICFSSNGNFINNLNYETKNTTPDLLTIYQTILKSQLSKGYIIIEISSQAINELRINKISFDLVAITNITQDHLDYHDNITDYFYTKARLLSQVKSNGKVLLNHDSPYYYKLNQLTPVNTYTFSKKGLGDYNYEIVDLSLEKSLFFITYKNNICALQTNLLGEFNIQNITTIFGVLSLLNLPLNNFSEFIKEVKRIKGRMNVYNFYRRTIIIDYAHTPDAVEKILSLIKSFHLSPIKLLIGCGGNRDRLKRPIIGKIACEKADFVYFTEDNSRDENPEKIIKEIVCDLTTDNYMVIENRFSAIKKMIKDSNAGDVLVLLGMGIDKSSVEKNEYNDLEMVLLALKELRKNA